MGETTLAEVATTLRHLGETLARRGETLVRLENKIEEARKEQRGEFKWLIGLGLAAIVAIIGAPHVLPPSAPAYVAPQYSPGGYTLVVNPYPAASSPAEGAAPTAAPTSASSN